MGILLDGWKRQEDLDGVGHGCVLDLSSYFNTGDPCGIYTVSQMS